MELAFSDHVAPVYEGEPNKLPPKQLPRHLFALYLGGFLGIEAGQMRTFIAARAYVSEVTLSFVPISWRSGKERHWEAKLDPREAVESLYAEGEIQPQFLPLPGKEFPYCVSE